MTTPRPRTQVWLDDDTRDLADGLAVWVGQLEGKAPPRTQLIRAALEAYRDILAARIAETEHKGEQ